jgi:sensor domain CHASE-containing protein
MPRSSWIGIIAGVIVLLAIVIWSSWGSGDERQAASAIMQAQRNISAADESHVEIDRDALRTAEAELLTAQTAFNQKQFKIAAKAAHRASRTAQDLLANPRIEQSQ